MSAAPGMRGDATPSVPTTFTGYVVAARCPRCGAGPGQHCIYRGTQTAGRWHAVRITAGLRQCRRDAQLRQRRRGGEHHG
jgi:hypothetical protein